MAFAIIDSSVYVDYWEGALEDRAFIQLREKFVIRQSSIVLSELRRGARTSQSRRLVEDLRKLTAIEWTPAADDWWQAGAIIQKIGDVMKWDKRKRQEFQNDALIALSARRYGATIITANRNNFELLGKELRISVFCI